MAKRRKLEAPSTEDLGRIEDEFRRETTAQQPAPRGRGMAPIAQVAAETAAQSQTSSAPDRAAQAKALVDSKRLQQAEAAGLLMVALPTAQIDGDAMVRDRSVIDEAELMELRESIAANGLRLPVEVFELAEPREDGVRYGLVSGYRRLMAVRALHALTGSEGYQTIRALIRPRTGSDAAFAAMVEENEVRSELSHFERGRIAVIAVQHGAFVNVEEAVNRLFVSASKAKRSKVRSFATIFEDLGDMLNFPEGISEKRGLRLAQALRNGAEPVLREGLAAASPADAEEEWARLESLMTTLDTTPRNLRRGGRPRAKPISGWQDAETLHTSSGITIRRQRDDRGFLLRFEGGGLDADLMDSLMIEIKSLLER